MKVCVDGVEVFDGFLCEFDVVCLLLGVGGVVVVYG